MAAQYWEILAVECTRPAGADACEFTAIVDGPAGRFRVDASPDALLSYDRLQRLILAQLGVVWAHPACEGRGQDGRDAMWHELLGGLVVQVVPAAPGGVESLN